MNHKSGIGLEFKSIISLGARKYLNVFTRRNITNINHRFTEIHILLKIKQMSDIMRPSIIYLAAVNTLTYIYRILKSDKAETEITDHEHLIPWSPMRLNF